VLFTPTDEGWKKLSKEFYDKWQMPNCVGALDGKHVVHQVCIFKYFYLKKIRVLKSQ